MISNELLAYIFATLALLAIFYVILSNYTSLASQIFNKTRFLDVYSYHLKSYLLYGVEFNESTDFFK